MSNSTPTIPVSEIQTVLAALTDSDRLVVGTGVVTWATLQTLLSQSSILLMAMSALINAENSNVRLTGDGIFVKDEQAEGENCWHKLVAARTQAGLLNFTLEEAPVAIAQNTQGIFCVVTTE